MESLLPCPMQGLWNNKRLKDFRGL
uniref:Uncharacterized protein n=1 Tax=Arundo donax TaxID=35708 RepID=A0A0A9H1S2_ARUDO